MRRARRDPIPAAARDILTPRTLANSHPSVLRWLRPGISVLDVGSGPGALTIEIARRVAPGPVIGMDVNPHMVALAGAASPPGELPNLAFHVGDIRQSRWERAFDLVNASRTLHWVGNPEIAVERMARALVPGGRLVVRDPDPARAEWQCEPPAWRRFYSAYLDWRADSGLDNAIPGRLAVLAEAAGLVDVEVTSERATVRAGEPDFFRAAGAWRMVAESRGRQMVAAGALREAERRAALREYAEWMRRPTAAYTSHDACLVARRKAAGRPGDAPRARRATTCSPARGIA